MNITSADASVPPPMVAGSDNDIPFVDRLIGRTPEEAARILAQRKLRFETERATAMDSIAALPDAELQRLYMLVPWRRWEVHPELACITDEELEVCVELMRGVRRLQARG